MLPCSAFFSEQERDYIMPCSQLTLCGHQEACSSANYLCIGRAHGCSDLTHTHTRFYSRDVCLRASHHFFGEAIKRKRVCERVSTCLCMFILFNRLYCMRVYESVSSGLLTRYSSASSVPLSKDVSELNHNRSDSPRTR